MSSMQRLLAEIDAYLIASGLGPTEFGVRADRDRSLMTRLRQGRPVTLAKADRIIAYMRKNPPAKPIKRQRRKVGASLSLVA